VFSNIQGLCFNIRELFSNIRLVYSNIQFNHQDATYCSTNHQRGIEPPKAVFIYHPLGVFKGLVYQPLGVSLLLARFCPRLPSDPAVRRIDLPLTAL